MHDLCSYHLGIYVQHDAGHGRLQHLRRHLEHGNEGDPCNNTCKGRTAVHQQPLKPTENNDHLGQTLNFT